jgi:oxygen tolerance protein BatD
VVRTIVCLAGFLLIFPVWALTQVSASVDKNPVTVKESIVLTIVADDDVDSNALDTSALLTDFVVGRTSVSSQTSMVNFKTSRTTKWTTLLIPKRQGALTIPSLNIEGQYTAPIQLTVLAADDPNASRQQELFITAEVSKKDVYVQQIFTLKVKLHFAAELKRGSLSEPSLEGATIAQVGEDAESDTIINGRRFRVIERTYSITPQESGRFVLTSPMFSGEIMVQSARRSNFLSFGETKPVSVVGEELEINVRPIPSNYAGQWLPSELLTLHEDWQPDPAAFKVGEPITRTITLTAAGVSSDQLPSVEFDLPAGLKVYPDQTELHSSLNNGRLISQSVRNFALVASQAGDFTLPAVNITWWNTVTNRIENATLPAKTISILPNANLPVLVPTLPNSAPQYTDQSEPKAIIIEKSSSLQWLFLALWLATSAAWLIQFLMSKRRTNAPEKQQSTVNDVHLAMLAACKKNDGNKAMNLLLPWVKNITTASNIHTINDAKQMFNHAEFNQAVDELYSHFYGNSAGSDNIWDGKVLLRAITSVYRAQSSKSVESNFALNP